MSRVDEDVVTLESGAFHPDVKGLLHVDEMLRDVPTWRYVTPWKWDRVPFLDPTAA